MFRFPSIVPRPRTARRPLRSGTATVELAVLLPIVLLVTLGAMEAASMIFLRQALVQSSYEAAKVAAKTGDIDAARANALGVTAGRAIHNVEIQFEPSNLNAAQPGDLIRVTVSAPGDANTSIPFGVFRGRIVAARATMARE